MEGMIDVPEREDSLSVVTTSQKFQPSLFKPGPVFLVHPSSTANYALYSFAFIEICKVSSREKTDTLRVAKTSLSIFMNNGHRRPWYVFCTVRLRKTSEMACYINHCCLESTADSEKRSP